MATILLSVVSCQLSVVSCQLLAVSGQRPGNSPVPCQLSAVSLIFKSMNLDILVLLVLLLLAVALFLLEWLSVDVVTLFLLVTLVLFGILSPEEAFSGFASEIVIILASIFVLSGALVQTGVMDWLGKAIHQFSGGSEIGVLICVMFLSALVSAFLSNTTATAILLPAVMGIARTSQVSPGRILIPLAFASMLGGTCTLIGTSTNLAASGLIQKMGMAPFSLFEFLPVGLTMVAVGAVYLVFVSYRILPQTGVGGLNKEYQIDDYLSEILVSEGSSLAGQTLAESPLSEMGFVVRAILRDDRKIYPQFVSRLREGDVLLVQASRDSLLQLEDIPDLEIRSREEWDESDFASEQVMTIEAIIMPQSILTGRTLEELSFRRRFGVSVLAIYRRGHAFATRLSGIALQVGDVLLLEGPPDQYQSLQGSRNLWALGEVERLPFSKRKGTYVLVALVLAVCFGGSQLMPLSIAFLLASLVVICMKCNTEEEVYRIIERRLIILIGGMTSFGLAMEKTQAADYLAQLIVDWTLPMGLYFVMGSFVVLTMLLTQPMSNAAAALVVLPVALSTATQLELNPRTFAVLITLSASLSFIAPLEPACLLVYGPGKYRFLDFVKSGLPLTIMAFIILMLLVPVLWPLK